MKNKKRQIVHCHKCKNRAFKSRSSYMEHAKLVHKEVFTGKKVKNIEVVSTPLISINSSKEQYEGDSTRSKVGCRMDLIPGEGLLDIGQRFYLGSLIHGEQNWKNGGKEFIKSVINHMEIHIQNFKAGLETQDDHIGAIGWAATALSWFKIHKNKEFCDALNELNHGKV